MALADGAVTGVQQCAQILRANIALKPSFSPPVFIDQNLPNERDLSVGSRTRKFLPKIFVLLLPLVKARFRNTERIAGRSDTNSITEKPADLARQVSIKSSWSAALLHIFV